MTKMVDHVVLMVREVTLSRTIKPNKDGDVLYVDEKENEDDVSDVSFVCDTCGYLKDVSDIEAHGFRQYWEEVS